VQEDLVFTHRYNWDFCRRNTCRFFPFVTLDKIAHAMTYKKIMLVYRYVDYYYATRILSRPPRNHLSFWPMNYYVYSTQLVFWRKNRSSYIKSYFLFRLIDPKLTFIGTAYRSCDDRNDTLCIFWCAIFYKSTI